MKKKVKKIPKYNGGTPAIIDPNTLNAAMSGRFNVPQASSLGTQQPIASMTQHQKAISNPGSAGVSGGAGLSAGNIASGIGNAATSIASAMGIEQTGVSAAFNVAGDIASVIPGVGTFIGAGLKTIGAFSGGGGRVDENTGEITKSSGLTRLFGWGRSDARLKAKSGRIKASNVAREQTQDVQADYYNNPNVEIQPNVLVAEGGIMRTPVDALVSKGELIYNPETKELTKVPGSKGKPNKADDVYTRLYEGDVVVSNSPTMLMTNGKTPAQNLENMVTIDKKKNNKLSEGTVKAREAIIKKVVAWQEANKTKPQEYAMYDEGTGKVKARKKEKIYYVVWNNKFGYFDAEGGFHDMNDVANPNLPDSAYLGRYEWVDAPIKKKNVGKHTSTELDFNTSRHTRDGVNDKKSESNWRKSPTQEEIDAFYGYNRKKVSETVAKDRSERINNKNRKYLVQNENENEVAGNIPEVVVTAPRINKASSKKDTGKKSSSDKTTAAAPKEVKPVEINQTGLDWARQEAVKAMSQYAPNTTRAVAPGLVSPKIDPTEIVEEAALPSYGTAAANGSTGSGSNGSDWKDNLYRMAVLSQPLWDRAKAESVDYTSPVYKYMPTAVDVSSQLRDADQSYALARYNFANLYPNTGAGMAAGLQAASNRAKQYADIRQYQTNAQNELIGKNVGIYNNWANEHARILNDVYNKSAQNRAAARNINRQNRAAALSNWGTMLSDDKKMTMDKLKLNMLEPMLQYGYQNYDGYLKWKKSNGYE